MAVHFHAAFNYRSCLTSVVAFGNEHPTATVNRTDLEAYDGDDTHLFRAVPDLDTAVGVVNGATYASVTKNDVRIPDDVMEYLNTRVV